jgi:hypothetical protein
LLSVPAGPWEYVSYDVIAKLPKCRGNDSTLSMVDCFSKIVATKERTRLKMPWGFEITLKGGNGTR